MRILRRTSVGRTQRAKMTAEVTRSRRTPNKEGIKLVRPEEKTEVS